MPFLCLQNGGNSPPKNSVTSLIFILNFQKNWIGFMMISKIKFSNKFDVGIVYVLNIGITIISFKLLFIRNFFNALKFVILIFLQLFCPLRFFLICTIFSIFFPIKIAKLRKFETKQICCCGRGGGKGGGEGNPTI